MLYIGQAAVLKAASAASRSLRPLLRSRLPTPSPRIIFQHCHLSCIIPSLQRPIYLPTSLISKGSHHLRSPALHQSAQWVHTDEMAENKFAADYAKMGTSGCKKCKQKMPKGSFRLAKLVSNPFSEEGGDMKQYHHPRCLFETFIKARATTKIIDDVSDINGYENLTDDDKELIKDLIKETMEKKGAKKTPVKKGKSPAAASKAAAAPKAAAAAASPFKASPSTPAPSTPAKATPEKQYTPAEPKDPAAAAKDNSFRQFRRICADIAEESSYTGKTAIVNKFITKGSTGNGYHGDKYLLLKLLLPGVVKTVYNLNGKQLVKIFSKIFGTSETDMIEDLEQGDVAETVRLFFEQSTVCPPHAKSTLSIIDVDRALTNLSKYTKEDDQQTVLSTITKRCTSNDLKMVVRLIKHDLRINSGAKHILDALDPNAYDAFQASRDLRDVVERVADLKDAKPGMSGKKLSIRANLMTPILPMLAEACKSVEYAFKKCPNGMYSEIKYDGERVQVHKQGDTFSYFSRSLKPVLPHKVNHFKDYIPLAFKHGNDLILDAEVLLIDTNTSKPLPFGTLGVHKKAAFQDANVCLFIFDCIHYNGENLLDRPIKARRKFLQENMTEVPNRILFSEMKHVTRPSDLKDMMMKVFREGLEGLVLKDVNGTYEPGKRHWLKVKKDYLAEGAMADTADLVVLGAYFGTGNKGGLMSIFLMGVWDPSSQRWCTVTKCGSGFDDKTLARLQKDFDMVKISKDHTRVPNWLNISRQLTPDFVVKDPKASQVWEITGAEFSKAEGHTAGGISIRFPRCTKMRDDKTWKEATTLPELRELFRASKVTSDMPDLIGGSPQKASKAAAGSSGSSTPGKSNGTTPTTTPLKRKSEPENDTVNSASKRLKSEGEPAVKSQHLPNVFSGMKLYIPAEVHNYDKMKRYVIAFDGDIVSEFEKDSATHIVVWNGPMPKSSQKHVTVEWVWRCIKKKKIIPFKGNH